MGVRKTLAASLHEIAKILGNDIAKVDLLPFFSKCLADVDEVRERLVENIEMFFRSLEEDTSWPLVHEVGDLLVRGQMNNWRLRERIMQSLPDLSDMLLSAERGRYLVVSLLKEGLTDKVAAVREAAINSVRLEAPIVLSVPAVTNSPAS